MLHDRRQRHRKRPGQFADRQALAFAKPDDQGTAGRVGEGGESAVQIRRRTVNHAV